MSKGYLGTDVICQIGLVVEDIKATGKAYADFFGMECPPVVASGKYEEVRTVYKGQPCGATCKMMFFNIGQLQLELIEPDHTPSVWRDDLNKNGEGFHHIAFTIKDTDGKVKILSEKGFSLKQAGYYPGGTGRYSYVDARPDLKLMLELLENF